MRGTCRCMGVGRDRRDRPVAPHMCWRPVLFIGRGEDGATYVPLLAMVRMDRHTAGMVISMDAKSQKVVLTLSGIVAAAILVILVAIMMVPPDRDLAGLREVGFPWGLLVVLLLGYLMFVGGMFLRAPRKGRGREETERRHRTSVGTAGGPDTGGAHRSKRPRTRRGVSDVLVAPRWAKERS